MEGGEAFAETAIRELVNEAAAVVGPEFLQRMQSAEKSAARADLVEVLWTAAARQPMARPGVPRLDIRDLATELREKASAAYIREFPADVDGNALAQLIAFSVRADELADDDYRDPRLPERPSGGG